ncbi:J domain-containing protein [Myxococcota bacterium]
MKRAYRDMAKVWHPDRFAHDPRLQQKAEQKLKEINSAYDSLCTYLADQPVQEKSEAAPNTGQYPGNRSGFETEPGPTQPHPNTPKAPAAEKMGQPVALVWGRLGWWLRALLVGGVVGACLAFSYAAFLADEPIPEASLPNEDSEQPKKSKAAAKGQRKARCRDGAPKACETQCAAGDANSCYSLATMLSNGEGAQKNPQRAAQLYETSCKGGVLEGCSTVALMYLTGNDVPRDAARARHLLHQSCEGGFSYSCGILGRLLFEGKQFPKDESRGVQLLQKACNHKNVMACEWLKKAKPE